MPRRDVGGTFSLVITSWRTGRNIYEYYTIITIGIWKWVTNEVLRLEKGHISPLIGWESD